MIHSVIFSVRLLNCLPAENEQRCNPELYGDSFFLTLLSKSDTQLDSIYISWVKVANDYVKKFLSTNPRSTSTAKITTKELHGLWSQMLSCNIITKSDKDLIMRDKTPQQQVGALLDHLENRTERDYEAFCECLKRDNQEHVVTDILCSEAQVPASNKSDVRQQLERRYNHLEFIQTAPEWAPKLALDSTIFYISLHLQIDETSTTQKEEFSQDEVFVPHRKQKTRPGMTLEPCNPKRILVEGDPGMGKSTLCRNLAFRWAREKCTGECKYTPCVHSWSLVIYLTAANIQGYDDIETAVRAHLLPRMTIDEVKDALNSNQSTVLFIVDSFDEGNNDNPILRDLIKGHVYANATLLLTSRPHSLKELEMREFESKLSTQGFNNEQKRFSPLNLAIICLLISEGLPSMATRTELYESVTKFLVKKASDRMGRPKEEIEEDIIRPLCRLSFEAYKRNEVCLSNEDLEKDGVNADDVLRSGFLTKEVKVSLIDDRVERLSFSHKTFLEYLAATHLVQIPGDLKDWLKTAAADWQHHYSLKSFFFDLLHGYSLVEASLVMMDIFAFSHEKGVVYNLPGSCLLLNVLRHLKEKTIILAPENENELKEKCRSIIDRTVECSLEPESFCCIEIIFATVSQSGESLNKSMNVVSEAKHVFDYLRNSEKCTNVNLRIECADESVANKSSIPQQGGHHSSFFSYAADRLTSGNIPLASDDDPNDLLRIALEPGFGNDIRGMAFEELKGKKKRTGIKGGLNSFLRAALDKPLTKLKIDSSGSMDIECGKMIVDLCSNSQLKVLYIRSFFVNDYRMQLLSKLSSLGALDELYVNFSMDNMDSHEICLYEQILKKNKMRELEICGHGISNELWSVFLSTIPTMSALKRLKIQDERFDFCSYDIWKSANDQLNLQSFTLRSLSLTSESFDNLCDLLVKWTQLRKLKIKKIEIAGERPKSNHSAKIIAAIAKCEMLEELHLSFVDIIDDVMDQFCEAVTQNYTYLPSHTTNSHRLPQCTVEGRIVRGTATINMDWMEGSLRIRSLLPSSLRRPQSREE
ncbi:hypothetical protein CAPTEDRAFT_209081 [Capitella teleta]|uniref:NACHT domain-containing protein n=1 Tax=Capitella teleta TaxID=283909 RepID=R7UIP5_CAPTE|nr:hypothetical protein CAPTEDRAFT_209081 [Capitella teleta]|eukprot:ELU03668.1 hypothetical protein CAPTEDRAFT_209081 [Capitella teleta]